MSMCHSGGSLRHPRLKVWPRLLACLCCVVWVGCGGNKPNDAESSDSQLSSVEESSLLEDSGSLAIGSESTTNLSADETLQSASGPATDAGIQLPAGDLPATGADGSGTGPPKSGGPTKPGGGGIEMPQQDSASGATASPGKVQMASWSAIETHAKSTGKITVVDLWSTACEPCIKEFPGLVRLSKSLKSDVACIGVSVDYDGRKSRPPETYSERVGLFLSSVGADFDNYLCNTPSDDVFAEVGLPSIPAVLVYDANGNLVKQFVDAGETIGFSYDTDVIPFVKKLAG